MTPDDKTLVCIGAFAGAHGIKGAVLVKSFTEIPENIASYGVVKTENSARLFTFTFVRNTKPGFVILSAPELSNREDAQALKGQRLYIQRDQLPPADEDEFYHQDLIGLDAVDENGQSLGFVKAIYNFGAGDMIELDFIPDIKGARIAPFTKTNVPTINIAAGKITILRDAITIDPTADVHKDEN